MLAASLVLQLAIILVVARVFGSLAKRVRQPVVIGEIIAGIALGPSLVGGAFPTLHSAVFSPESRPALTLIGQTGVVLFMFAIGTRVELDAFRRRSRAITAIATAAIVVPFILGAGLGAFLYRPFADATLPRLPFVLFIATAMSVTAFPVLARIISERRLESTVAGHTALVCAAINDAVAWMLVATVLGLMAGDERSRIPLAVHGVFAAFVGGAVCAALFPQVVPIVARIEAFASRLLLPVFFALTGLRTDLWVLAGGAGSWIWCAIIIAVATVGKFGGTSLAAVKAGMARLDALKLGALMNTRGLMELVVLNIGYEIGLLSPALFAMMVVMTLVTTCAAGPLVDRWSKSYASASAVAAP